MEQFTALTHDIQLALVSCAAVVLFLLWGLFQQARHLGATSRPAAPYIQDCIDIVIDTAIALGLWIGLNSVTNLPFVVGFLISGILVLTVVGIPTRIAQSGKPKPGVTRQGFLTGLVLTLIWSGSLLYLAADIWRTYVPS